jgi:hypothetical protein
VLLCISVIHRLCAHKLISNVELLWPALYCVLYGMFISKSSVRVGSELTGCYLLSGYKQVYAHDAIYKHNFNVEFRILCCPVVCIKRWSDISAQYKMSNLFQVHFCPSPQQRRQHLSAYSAVWMSDSVSAAGNCTDSGLMMHHVMTKVRHQAEYQHFTVRGCSECHLWPYWL